MKSTTFLTLLAAIVIAATGCTFPGQDSTTEDSTNTEQSDSTESNEIDTVSLMNENDATEDVDANETTEAIKQESSQMDYMYKGDLDPVDGSNSSGVAMASFKDGEYMMRAEIRDLPDPEEGFFYEGWVVRKEPFAFISTGELEKEGDAWINVYNSSTDYTDYNRYVLTIEPDDGDPAPADHVVEGDMMKVDGQN